MQSGAERQRLYRERHPERVKSRVAIYQASARGKEIIAAYKASEAYRETQAKHRKTQKRKAALAKYRRTEKCRISQRKHDATPQGQLRRSLRDRVRKIFQRGKGIRAGSAVRDLGCSIEFFKEYISGQFLFGMSWDNYGYWHLDHIRPLASFDLTDRAQFLE